MYGYGNSMFLATTGILARPSGGIDPDAQAFITAAGITDPTQQAAINTLVVDLKGYNIWSKMKALYPFVGGTAAQHKWNLKDPRDLDAAFRLTYGGSVTHSANGVTGGINGFCDTKFNDSTNFTSNTNASFSVYTRNNFVNDANYYTLIGCSTDNHVSAMTIRGTIYNEFLGLRDAIGSRVIGVISNRLAGQYLLTKDGTNRRYFKNSSNINTTANGTSNPANRSLYLLADNYSGGTGYYAQHTIAFAHIGDNLTNTEAANLYTAVQAFQTTLGRSIGTQTVSDADAQAFVTNAGIVASSCVCFFLAILSS